MREEGGAGEVRRTCAGEGERGRGETKKRDRRGGGGREGGREELRGQDWVSMYVHVCVQVDD